MSKIPVRESVGAVLQPNHDSMDLGDRADERMMDIPVHRDSSHEKT